MKTYARNRSRKKKFLSNHYSRNNIALSNVQNKDSKLSSGTQTKTQNITVNLLSNNTISDIFFLKTNISLIFLGGFTLYVKFFI